MKKILLLALISMCFLSISNAQSKYALSIGGNIVLPMGDFGNFAGTGFGASVTGEYPFQNNLVGTATIGYISWGGKDYGFFKYSYSVIPILAGVKYFFQKSFYAYGQLGIQIFSSKFESSTGLFTSGSSSNSEFSIGLGAGYEFNNFDLTAMLNVISNSNYVCLRAAYKIPLK